MDLCSLVNSVIDPTTKFYGAISLAASIGTIAALVVTIKSVNESRNQSKLVSKRRAIDNIFSEFEHSLNRIIFEHKESSGLTIYKGVDAILYANSTSSLHLFKENANCELLEEYLDFLSVYSGTIMLILSSMDDGTSRRIYEGKLRSEFRFVREHISPLLTKLISMANSSQLSKLSEKLQSLSKNAVDVASYEIVNGSIKTPDSDKWIDVNSMRSDHL